MLLKNSRPPLDPNFCAPTRPMVAGPGKVVVDIMTLLPRKLKFHFTRALTEDEEDKTEKKFLKAVKAVAKRLFPIKSRSTENIRNAARIRESKMTAAKKKRRLGNARRGKEAAALKKHKSAVTATTSPTSDPMTHEGDGGLPTEVPTQIQKLITNLPGNAWSSSSAGYRACKALHFGLGVPCNKYITKASRHHAILEAALVSFARRFDVSFTSIIVNRYVIGNEMGEHRDLNLAGHAIQMVGVFGEFEGGDLFVKLPSGQEQVLGQGARLMNANNPHRVSRVSKGTRYSVISYAKDYALAPSSIIDGLRARSFRIPNVD